MVIGVFIIGIMLIGIAVSAILETQKSVAQTRHGKINAVTLAIRMIGIAFFGSGFIGFIGSAALSFGLGKFIPNDLELPIERRSIALLDVNRTAYVPLEGRSRIQVYDADAKFIRGWYYETFGGTSKVWLIGDTIIRVATAREQKLFFYSTQGVLLRTEGYSPLTYSSFSEPPFTMFEYKTPWYLLPFSSIFGSIGLGVFGIIILNATSYLTKRKAKSC